MTEEQKEIDALDDQLIELCEQKGFTGEMIFIVGALVHDEKSIQLFGSEQKTIKTAITVLEVFDNIDDPKAIFSALYRTFDNPPKELANLINDI